MELDVFTFCSRQMDVVEETGGLIREPIITILGLQTLLQLLGRTILDTVPGSKILKSSNENIVTWSMTTLCDPADIQYNGRMTSEFPSYIVAV
ncbi:hypothetical protein OUZ56_021701 [Daphnia magna]|uniref:GMP synthase n=1 Tax=Daphnia magna TaxID=35525 RepID=A0ABR0AUS0_9CRUS|nr:hypothetical protein OUZ56_021701 [Daphnia magna]